MDYNNTSPNQAGKMRMPELILLQKSGVWRAKRNCHWQQLKYSISIW